MKTKRRNYWSFFWRVGAGFLAFWLVVMAGFTLLLGWQTAQEMHTVMTENLKHFYNDWLQEQLHWYKTDEFGRSLKEFLNRPFANDMYLDDYVGSTITETAVLSADNEILQDDTGWLRAEPVDEPQQTDPVVIDETSRYPVVLDGQPKRVYGAAMAWMEKSAPYPRVTVEGWLVDGWIYPKNIIVQQRGYDEERGTGVDVGEPVVTECQYDAAPVRRHGNTALSDLQRNNTGQYRYAIRGADRQRFQPAPSGAA